MVKYFNYVKVTMVSSNLINVDENDHKCFKKSKFFQRKYSKDFLKTSLREYYKFPLLNLAEHL